MLLVRLIQQENYSDSFQVRRAADLGIQIQTAAGRQQEGNQQKRWMMTLEIRNYVFTAGGVYSVTRRRQRLLRQPGNLRVAVDYKDQMLHAPILINAAQWDGQQCNEPTRNAPLTLRFGAAV